MRRQCNQKSLQISDGADISQLTKKISQISSRFRDDEIDEPVWPMGSILLHPRLAIQFKIPITEVIKFRFQKIVNLFRFNSSNSHIQWFKRLLQICG